MIRRHLLPAFFLACTLLTVQAFGTAVCTVDAAATAFGLYDSLSSSNDDTLGTITVRCTGNIGDPVNYNLALNAGQNGTFSNRVMDAGSSQLSYNLYIDAGRTNLWGDGTSGTSTLSGSYNLSSTSDTHTFTVYARAYGGQNTAAMSPGYTDTVMITLTY